MSTTQNPAPQNTYEVTVWHPDTAAYEPDIDNMPRYPDIVVPMVGEDGNAAAIIGRVTRALRRNGVSNDEIAKFRAECMSGDYDNVLITVMRWVEVE